MATVTGACREDGTVDQLLVTDEGPWGPAGSRWTWLSLDEEGAARVQAVLAAWNERVNNDGAIVGTWLASPVGGVQALLSPPDECTASLPRSIALVSLTLPSGSVARVACDAMDFPGGPGAVVAGGGGGVVPSPALEVVRKAREAVGGALTAIGDKVAELPTPREALRGVAEGLGDAAGTVVGAFTVAGARGGSRALEAFWDELPAAGKAVAALAGALALFVGVRALVRAVA